MPNSVRVRFAPSPTGYLHVGGARTALFNWLYARHRGGKFILRIEDTDEARNTPEARQAIFDGMKWLGLDWDEGPDSGGDCGPYFQSQRKDIYDAYFAKLEAAGRVYAEENGAMRFKFSREPVIIPDMVCGDVHFAATEEPDMTIRRPDGSYIFHFVNVVDDAEMGITHVIRGEDHLSNTWKHIDLFHAFGKHPPKYAHIPLILNPTGSKMSKRDEGSSIQSYIDAGFLPEAVFNYLCLLGWTPKGDAEKLDREAIISLFDPKEIHSANARFDMVKCTWFNAQYLRALEPAALYAAALPFLQKERLTINDSAIAERALQSVKEKVSLLAELPCWVHYFFKEEYTYEDEVITKLKAKPENPTLLKELAADFAALSTWDEHAAHASVEATAKRLSVKPGALMPLLRFALTGQSRGPGVATILVLLGKD
ncbi:MAG: glutamyl-tRNA synthetase [Verrucomicrobiaceae bacterium]|nr:glutamyl-tRNA synthetase [Verrucomicrobiaceae bacterium]